MNVIIYGAGQTGEQVYRKIQKTHNVIGFLDGNKEKKGMMVSGIMVHGGVEVLDELEYDQIYIGSTFWKDIKKLLIESGVESEKIVIDIPEDIQSPVRTTWLECYAKLHPDWKYAVAEGGVYRGEFSAIINKCFPESKLYLFDTFNGFDERDIELEKQHTYSNPENGDFSNTSVDLVLSKMIKPELVEIHKGYFPESAQSVKDRFCFVNLDFDLYQPILEGLRFFFPQMIDGSVILVHDYYHAGLLGVKEAISKFEEEVGKTIIKMPIGDNQSIALIK